VAKGDLKSKKAIYAKGTLFLALGTLAASLIIADQPNLKTAALLLIVVWSFCRAYYFAFYVIQHYVDDSYRFAGLIDFVRYLLGKPRV